MGPLARLPVLLSGLCLCCTAGHALTLIDDGRASATAYVAASAPEQVQHAAQELTNILGRMSDAHIPVAHVASAREIDRTRPGIVLGELAEELGLTVARSSRSQDGFRYRVAGKQLLVAGESPRGIGYAVFDFLETLGCGWYTPGELGEVVPRRRTIIVPDALDRAETSDSISRRFWYGGKGQAEQDWLVRNKAEHSTGSWSHAWRGLVPPDVYFEEHPEYFSLNRGERTPKQLCTTNRDTIRIAAETLMQRMAERELSIHPAGPNDGGNLCECRKCARLDTRGYTEFSSGKPACSDRVFKFGHDVAELTSQEFPDKDLGVLVYSEYSRVPVRLKQLHPNVFPMFAPIRRCRLHGPGNPLCHWAELWAEEIRGWDGLTKKMGFYIYNYNLADTLVPLGKIDFYRRLVDVVHKLDIEELAWTFETMDSWAMHAPHMYLSARLSWDSHLDIDAEMERFFAGFYAEAAAPMRRYWLRIDDAYATAPTHTGSQYGLHHIWTDELLRESRSDIDQAKRLAASDRVREAVAMADAGLQCAELFMRIRTAIVGFDFLAAESAQEDLKSHIAMMAAKPEPHWAHERYAWGYYERFTGRTVTGGANVLRDGGRILVKFPDVWKFRKDPKTTGARNGWHRPKHDDADGADMATFSKSWDDQGLGWYHGDAWYRTRFDMLVAAEDADLRLWFGGFDHNVDVYVNGQSLGEKTGFATPCEFEGIGEHLKLGGENVLAVRVSAGGLAELGTGGIMMPVMIYSATGS
jgi:hypothetical protein